jgi:hypothetical protein
MASVKTAWIKKYGYEEGIRRYEILKKSYRSVNSTNPPLVVIWEYDWDNFKIDTMESINKFIYENC